MTIKENNDTYYIRNLLYLRSEKLRNVQDKSIILTNKTRKLFNKNRQKRPSTMSMPVSTPKTGEIIRFAGTAQTKQNKLCARNELRRKKKTKH